MWTFASLAIQNVTFSVIVDFVFTSHSARLKQKKKKYIFLLLDISCENISLTPNIDHSKWFVENVIGFFSRLPILSGWLFNAIVMCSLQKHMRVNFIQHISCVVSFYSLILSHKSHYAHRTQFLSTDYCILGADVMSWLISLFLSLALWISFIKILFIFRFHLDDKTFSLSSFILKISFARSITYNKYSWNFQTLSTHEIFGFVPFAN